MSPSGAHLANKIFIGIFRYSGIWFPEQPYYLIYPFVLYILFPLPYWIFSGVILYNSENAAEVTQALYMFIICCSFLVKTTCFLFYNKRIQALLAPFELFELYNENERKLVDEKMKYFLRPLKMFLTVTPTCSTYAAVKSIVQSNPGMPRPCWHPLDWKNDTLAYWCAWLHLYLATSLAVATNVEVQLFSSYLMFFISVLMEVLGTT